MTQTSHFSEHKYFNLIGLFTIVVLSLATSVVIGTSHDLSSSAEWGLIVAGFLMLYTTAWYLTPFAVVIVVLVAVFAGGDWAIASVPILLLLAVRGRGSRRWFDPIEVLRIGGLIAVAFLFAVFLGALEIGSWPGFGGDDEPTGSSVSGTVDPDFSAGGQGGQGGQGGATSGIGGVSGSGSGLGVLAGPDGILLTPNESGTYLFPSGDGDFRISGLDGDTRIFAPDGTELIRDGEGNFSTPDGERMFRLLDDAGTFRLLDPDAVDQINDGTETPEFLDTASPDGASPNNDDDQILNWLLIALAIVMVVLVVIVIVYLIGRRDNPTLEMSEHVRMATALRRLEVLGGSVGCPRKPHLGVISYADAIAEASADERFRVIGPLISAHMFDRRSSASDQHLSELERLLVAIEADPPVVADDRAEGQASRERVS